MKNCLKLSVFLLAGSLWAENVNVVDFGAIGDGKTLATAAMQKAIDRCAESGGGTVTVPPGAYLTHTLFLKSHVNLHIQQGGVILGSTEPKAFTQAVVYANEIEDAAITGPGIIDGQGSKKWYPPKGPRHNNIQLFKSKNIRVQDVTLINSSVWVLRIRQCDGIQVRGVRIYSFANYNNDGIDIEGKNITVSDCTIDCDDDAVCLKSDDPNYLVENIAISNCVIASNCNAIKFGTASWCGFKNVAISNCAIRRPSEGSQRRWASTIQGVSRDETVISGIALEVVDGGMMDQVAISNITMTGIQTPLFIRLGSRHGAGSLRNVVIDNIVATNESLITSSITGIPGSYVENVSIRNIIFNYKGTGTLKEANTMVPEVEKEYPENRMFGYSLPAYGLYVRHVKNLDLENFRFNLLAPDARPALMLDDCHHIRLANFHADAPAESQPLIRLVQSSNVTVSGYQTIAQLATFMRVEGEKSSNIKVVGNDLTGVKTVAETKDGCPEKAIKTMNNYN